MRQWFQVLRLLLLLSILLSLALFGCGEQEEAPRPELAEDLSFPEEFLFGASISGFQAEMGCPTLSATECDDVLSDWYAFATSPVMLASADAHLSGEDPAVVGPGFRELFAEDIERASVELGHGAFRFSIEWSRVFPEPTDEISGYEAMRAVASPSALAYYHSLLDELSARGIKPLVTLSHDTLPWWIHDAVGCHLDLAHCEHRGFLDKERTLNELTKYAAFVAREFGADVDLWATLNEPIAVFFFGYVHPTERRSHPPGVTAPPGDAKQVFLALVEAHARMYDAIKENDARDADGDGKMSEVGVAASMVPAVPRDPERHADVEAAKNLFYLYNRAYLDAVIKGELDAELSGHPEHREDLANRMDWVGVDYSTRLNVQGTSAPSYPELSKLSTFDPQTLQFEDDDPQGLYEMIALVHREYGLPAIVTENGLDHPADNEEAGPSYLVRHLTWAARALQDGMDVRGYFWKSLTDGFEWNRGTSEHFGLYSVSPEDPQKNRTARPTAATYGEIARERRIAPELLIAYPAPRVR